MGKLFDEEWCKENNYSEVKEIKGVWCGVSRFAFTTAIVVGLDKYGYNHRYCYPAHTEATLAFMLYEDPSEAPKGNWIKRKGSGGDYSNPNYIQE